MQRRYLDVRSSSACAVRAFVCFYLLIPGSGIASAESLVEVVESRLGGTLIADARAGDLVRAVSESVSANPGDSAAILTDVLTVKRSGDSAGPLVAAAIEGLGTAPSRAAIAELVQIGANLEPAALLNIVANAVRAAPRADAIVIVSAAALSSPDTSSRTRQAIVGAALGARPDYHLDAAVLRTAVDRSLRATPRRANRNTDDSLENELVGAEELEGTGIGGNLGSSPFVPPSPQPASQ